MFVSIVVENVIVFVFGCNHDPVAERAITMRHRATCLANHRGRTSLKLYRAQEVNPMLSQG